VNNSQAFIVRNLCASHIVAEKMVIALLAVALLREEACMDRQALRRRHLWSATA
jgi:hypothetical protein